ncbi:right-handed parallel beta-helix repeat-containing protein [Candidatus Eisenbacteria bacterium]|uniref:Right-handed parallel beta-helix repeat-containing protein n=1 Tax=Eiseniibacteriota bacterium TaxID=2212470 RepID=A0ABV6YKU9_UNCEI
MRVSLVLSLCMVVTGLVPAFATIIEVPGAGSLTIQDGLDLAQAGDTVLVAPGVYAEYNIVMESGVALIGQSAPGDSVVIDAARSGTCMTIPSASSSTLIEDITFYRGYAPVSPGIGGGLRISGSANPTLRGCTIRDCESVAVIGADGGGVSCQGTSTPRFEDCTFVGNSSLEMGGAVFGTDDTAPVFDDCVFEDNKQGNPPQVDYGGAVFLGAHSSGTFNDCWFLRNKSMTAGGAISLWGGTTSFAGCHFEADSSNDAACIHLRESTVLTLTGCTFVDNYASRHAGVLASQGQHATTIDIDNCTFVDNTAGTGHGGAMLLGDYSSTEIDFCTFLGNAAGGGGGAVRAGSSTIPTVISNCVFVGNESDNGSAAGTYHPGSSVTLILEGCIVTGNLNGAPFHCHYPIDEIQLSCCNVYDNVGGNWVDCWADQYGIDGNISADPLFCDADNNVFTVQADSPCLPGNHPDGEDCGLIGVLDMGCYGEAPEIISISDVGNDEGGQVRLIWYRSEHDSVSSEPLVDAYGIYRRQDEFKRASASEGEMQDSEQAARLEGWDFIESVPARGDDIYQYVAPTLCDSTEQGGVCWSVFFISAMTTDPHVFFDSAPDSGYSVDNLAPPPPGEFAVEYMGAEGNRLSWQWERNREIIEFRIYRGLDAGSPADSTHFLYATFETEYWDSMGTSQHHYKLTSVDEAGNESDPVEPEVSTDVNAEFVPMVWPNLCGSPNPFGSETAVRFNLPEATSVAVTIHSSDGRRVKTLADEMMPAGSHEIHWDGRDHSGHPVASGVYLIRLIAGSSRKCRVLLRIR